MRIMRGGAILASAAALLLPTACGSSSDSGKTAASPSSSASGGFAAYAACLRQHGVNIPTTVPSARPSGGRGAGGLFRAGGGANSGAFQKARQACQSLQPRGGFGLGQRGMQELQAFRSCLSDHGVKLPTPSPVVRSPGARPTPGARRGNGFLRGLSTADPKVAKAYNTCKALLPTPSARPTGQPTD